MYWLNDRNNKKSYEGNFRINKNIEVINLEAEQKIYRGPRPFEDDIVELKNRGVKSIVNLQREDTSKKDFIEKMGLKFFHISIEDHTAPTIEQIEEFMEIALNEENLPLYVHCYAGMERTGTMIACYRIYNGWHCEDAIAYNYHEVRWPLMESQQEVVREYAEKLEGKGLK